jgi:hypothetical protein
MKTPKNTTQKLAIILASFLFASCSNPATVKLQVENNFIDYFFTFAVIWLLWQINKKLKKLVVMEEEKTKEHVLTDEESSNIATWMQKNPGKTVADYRKEFNI